eukprot:symbB.v1.2.027909.t1/scaffold2900.1/size67660/2
MPSIGDEVYRLGMDLSNEAMAALEQLPFSHSSELLEATKQKFESGHLKDPSNYICATVSRGYVPRTGGKGAIGSSIHTDMRNVLQEADDDPSVEDMDSWYEETMYDESVEFLAREAQERLQLSKLERACIGVSEAIAVALSFRDMMISTCKHREK